MVNDSFRDKLFIVLGIVGAVINGYGQLHVYPQPFYVVGSFLLLIVAVHFKFLFYMGLEAILLAGHFALMLDLNDRIQIALPILLCLQLLVYYYLVGRFKRPWLWIGLSGIALLSIGFAYQNLLLFFVGSVFISLYSYYRIPHTKGISLIWALLNTFFAILVAFRLYLQFNDFIF